MRIPGGRASGGWGAGAVFRSVLLINGMSVSQRIGVAWEEGIGGGRIIGWGTPSSQPSSRLRNWFHPVHVSPASQYHPRSEYEYDGQQLYPTHWHGSIWLHVLYTDAISFQTPHCSPILFW